MVLAMNRIRHVGRETVAMHFEQAHHLLATTRPTAVNLFWALDRMRQVFEQHRSDEIERLCERLLKEAMAIHQEDAEMCERISEHGEKLLPAGATVLTHCNTGRLATGGRGTALGIIERAWELGALKNVYIAETRPLLQGARLTAWELARRGVPATLIADHTGAFLMQQGRINAVVVGADRIAANGDVANKVGTYSLAIAAHHHGIPFFVAAPSSSIDFETVRGALIPIEERPAEEITTLAGTSVAPEHVTVYAPAFDVTPHQLITAIVTERGVVQPPNAVSLCSLRSAPLGREHVGVGT
jgi:methylthioribose-1-phosphate isomerase